MLVCKRETLALAGTLCFIVGIWCKRDGITSVGKLKVIFCSEISFSKILVVYPSLAISTDLKSILPYGLSLTL
jgi:hypothetical protein